MDSRCRGKGVSQGIGESGTESERHAMRAQLAQQGFPPPEPLAKAHEMPAAAGRFIQKFHHFFHEDFPTLNWWSEAGRRISGEAKTDPDRAWKSGVKALLGLRNHLGFCWREPDLRTKEWRCLWLRQYADHFSRDPRVELGVYERLAQDHPPATLSPIDQALLFFLKNVDSARHCSNPDCLAPYFFARRPRQRFCSTTCAMPAQREYKRIWWNKYGRQWREARSQRRRRKSIPR